MQRYLYWYWNKFFSLKQIKKLNLFIKNNYVDLEPDLHKAKHLDDTLKKNTVTYRIYFKKIKHLLSTIMEEVYSANSQVFGYDLYSLDKFNDLCLYNIYTEKMKGNYDWHIDESQFPYLDIKLTLLINLSEKPFEGGNLLLNSGNIQTEKNFNNSGSVLIFPSHTLHSVTPVLKGDRRTLTLFLTGPKLK